MDRRQFLAGPSALAASKTVRAATGPVNKVSARLLRLKVSDGTWIAIEEGGNGPSLLLVHGSGRAVGQYHFDPASFAQVRTPMMFFLGSESAKPIATSVRTVAEALHNTVTTLPGQQHDAMYTAPDRLARDLTAYFLA
jgi:pimeloyl-ACP methyl ester carboxylesterase